MQVYFTQLSTFEYQAWEHGHLEDAQRFFATTPEACPYRLAPSEEEAELIVVFETNRYKSRHDRGRFEGSELLQRHANKVFTINYDDAPAGFLPGLYVGLAGRRYRRERHRAWGYLFPPHPLLLVDPPVDRPREWFFTFRGALSHPVRKQLLATPFACPEPHRVVHIDRWFNHTAEEKTAYIDEILASDFVLCPRGICTATHRCFEVMALARCPVIIADEWIAPTAIDWEQCSVRITSAEIPRLPEILRARRADAVALGARARQEWLRCFGPQRRFVAALDELVALRDSRPAGHDERAAQARLWRSTEFLEANGWTLAQRLRAGVTRAVRRLLGRPTR